MARAAKHHFWRRCRIYFRRLRILVWLTLLTIICALVYLDTVGLPDFAKRWVIQELRTHGLEVEFSRLRLDWYHGIVADDMRFDRAEMRNEPRFTAKQVSIHPDLSALARLQLKVDSLGLHQGRIEWPVVETNTSLSSLDVDSIEARLNLRDGDVWSLDNFQARFAGADFTFSGTITNASAMSRWKWFKKRQPDTPNLWLTRLQSLANTIRQLSFFEPPTLRVVVHGDAEKPEGIIAYLHADARNARTPWGDAKAVVLVARTFAGDTNGVSQLELNLDAQTVRTRWGDAETVVLSAQTFSNGTNGVSQADIDLNVGTLHSPWGEAKQLHLIARIWPGTTNDPGRADLTIDAATVQTHWGSARKFSLRSAFAQNSNPANADESLGPWAKAFPWSANWNFEATGLHSHNIDAQHVECGGNWLAPRLAITNVSASLGGGALAGNARLDVVSRELAFGLNSTVDPRAVESVLTPKTRLWLTQFSWLANPHVRGDASLTLPAWTNRQPDWRAEVQPTLCLAAEFAGTNVAYRGVEASWARSHISYTNLVWRLPDLQVHRPEGTLFLAHQEDDRTKDYHWQIRGPIDPRALRPLLGTNQHKAYEIVNFTGPVTLDGDIWGRLYDYERIGCQFQVAATNFSVRGISFDTFHSAVRYTNLVIECLQPNLTRGAQMMYADGVTVNFQEHRVYFTNGFSMADPNAVAHAIGPKVEQALAPYRFVHPPVVHLHGYVPLKGNTNVDVHFTVEGGPFEWWKFKVPQIEGNVHWFGNFLLLTNINAQFYDGTGRGFAFFDFHEGGHGADYNFTFGVTNANFHSLMTDIGSLSNRMEGVLTGLLVVTNASTTNWHSWNGKGRVQLADGYLWDIPLFGVFSPILNGIVPGMGGGRATEANARFVITNGVVFSDSLSIRSTMMRLQYEGTVDFDGSVDARVEAELLRDTWLLGRMLSLAFKPVTKLLEYKVTGTLFKPKPEPLYFIPKLLLIPLHPIRTLEELFPSTSDLSTNAPPAAIP